jgi:hypothetical protein
LADVLDIVSGKVIREGLRNALVESDLQEVI